MYWWITFNHVQNQLKESYLNHRNTNAHDYYAHSQKKILNVCTLDFLQKPVLQSGNKKKKKKQRFPVNVETCVKLMEKEIYYSKWETDITDKSDNR